MAGPLDVGDVLETVRHRDLNSEGIPMFLALHGARPAPPGDARVRIGARLAGGLLDVHERVAALAAAGSAPDAEPDASAIETPVDDDDVVAESKRAVSVEEFSLAEAVAVLAHAAFAPGGDTGWPQPDPGRATADPAARPDVTPLLARTVRAWREGRVAAVVNYHNTPASSATQIAHELAGWGERFAPVATADMAALFDGAPSRDDRLPLIPVFYEGYRNNYTHGAPACDAAGLTGWFFLITQFLDTPVPEQRQYALAHHIGMVDEERDEDRLAMTWSEAAELSRRHVVTSHTANHRAALRVSQPPDIDRELVEPARKIREHTGRPALAHAWLHGSGLHGPGHAPDGAQRERLAGLGYRWLFGNIGIDRLA